MKNRIKIIAVVTVGVVLFAGYAGYWFYVAGRLERGIDDWVALQRQAGLTVDFERTPVSGFPFAFRSTFRKPHIAGAFAGRGFDWQGPDLDARVSPFNLQAIDLRGPGRHEADFGDGPIVLDAAGLEVRLAFAGNGLLSSIAVSWTEAKLAARGGAFAAGAGSITLTMPASPPQADGDPLLQFAASTKSLTLPKGRVVLTEDSLIDLQLAGQVKGMLPMAPLRQALASWRDAGGTVEIARFAATQATLSLSGSATIALDDNLQPIVAADVKARGLAPTIDLLTSQHRIYPEDAQKMKLFVKGAERDAPGGYKEVATGLTLQGGWLSWGPFKLVQVPPIEWP